MTHKSILLYTYIHNEEIDIIASVSNRSIKTTKYFYSEIGEKTTLQGLILKKRKGVKKCKVVVVTIFLLWKFIMRNWHNAGFYEWIMYIM